MSLIDLKKLTQRKPTILDKNKMHNSAVLLPIVNQQGRECILFEIRSQKLKFQPGEICFPGGGVIEEDIDAETAALRETCEELNLSHSNIKILAQLDILVTPFNAIITPFAGLIEDSSLITPNPDEVDSIFYVPLQFFLDCKPQTYYVESILKPPNNFPYELIPNNKSYNWQKGSYPVHFYLYKEKIIWGITARIIKNFIDICL